MGTTPTTAAATGSDLVVQPAADVVDDIHLIATDPQQMQIAQRSLSEWFAAKVAITQRDADDLHQEVEIARKNGWRTATLERLFNIACKRIDFYEKCKAAVDAGYCIVPNLPVTQFAIRTTRKSPDKMLSKWSGINRNQQSNSPPLGAGKYKDPTPVLYEKTHYATDPSTKEKKEIRKDFWNESFREEIEFPISVARPQIMNATAEAMALKCFDAMGVLPEPRGRKSDPIVVGIIRNPKGPDVTFMVAWYVDTSAL